MYFYNNTSFINNKNLITINNQTIECVKQYKFPGIHIDNKLKYKKHITELKIKIDKLIYLFKKFHLLLILIPYYYYIMH